MVLLTNNSSQKAVDSVQKLLLTIFLLLTAYCLLLTGSARAEEKVYLIEIEGMHCKMCVYNVTKSLKKLKQVKDVNVSLKNGTAVVTLNDGKDVTPDALKEAVEDAGYKPTVVKAVTKYKK